MNVRQEGPEPEEQLTAGQDFVRRIRPAGCVLFMVVLVLVLAICFTSGRNPIPGYEPPQTTEYYAGNPEALVQELEENVFPALPEYTMTAEAADGAVTVTIDSGHFVVGRSALLRYFDESLITFVRGE